MNRSEKIAFSICLLGIAVAVLSANLSPARGYELSILRATPPLFWIGISFPLIGGTVGALMFGRLRSRTAAAALAVSGVMIIALLPVIRSYYFYGQSDALQHLGWATDIVSGLNLVGQMFYPALHTLAAMLTQITSLPVNRTLVFLMPCFYLVFVLSLPLLARMFVPPRASSNRQSVVPIALLFSLLTPPIIAVRMPNFQPIPTVAGLFLVPLLLWIGISISQVDGQSRGRYSVFVVLFVALIFYHPQQSLAGMLALGCYVSASVLVDRLSGNRSPAATSTVLNGTIVGGTVLAFWLSNISNFGAAISSLIIGLQGSSGASVAVPGTGLQQIGGSIIDLFLRVLLIPTLIGLTAGATGVIILFTAVKKYTGGEGGTSLPSSKKVTFQYLVAFLPIFVIAMLTLSGGKLAQSVRYIGLLVALATPVVALQFWQASYDHQKVKVIVVVVLLIGTALAVPTMFRTPYNYQATPHVTEAQLSGYDWLFDYQAENTPISSVDTDVRRQLLATAGFLPGNERAWKQNIVAPTNSTRGPGLIPAHFADRTLTEIAPSPWYLVSTSWARTQHTTLYDGLQFTEGDFQHLNQTSVVSKTFTNGDMRVYHRSSTRT